MPKDHNHIEVIARAVLIDGGRILLCRNDKGEYYYLPGGHVEFGEPAAAALSRELLEECGLRAHGALLLVTEGVFETRKKSHHEINLAFHVERDPPGADPTTITSREPGISFHWIDLAALPETDLRPDSVKAFLSAGGRPDPAAAPIAWISEIH